jgi:hypothetical protein
MALYAHSHTLVYVKPLGISRIFDALRIPMPSQRSLLVTDLLLGSFLINLLMLLGILPLSLLLGFIGFAMMGTGGTLAMVFSGEI